MFDAVIKCGGSLTRRDSLPDLCRRLAELGRRHRLLLVPGGGPFADMVREADRRYRLSDDAAHWMAILAMDQYGCLLSDLIPESRTTRNLQEALEIARTGSVPVILPFDLLYRADPLPHSWSVTSDSLSAWIAATAGAAGLVLLKDVDGLYAPNSDGEEADRLLEAPTLDQLEGCEGVDPFLGTLLSEKFLDVWIINGNEPDRLEDLLEKGRTLGTHLQR